MLVFIDESGVHNGDGQTATALVYVEVKNAQNLDAAILAAEAKLKIKPFHWKEHGWKIRQAFLERLIKEDFEVKIFVFGNPFTEDKLERAWRHLFVDKKMTKIIIDGDKPERYVHRLKKLLRDNDVSVKKIRMGNDRSFPCLRLADLFAGATRAYFEAPENNKAKKLYNLAYTKITTQLMGGQAFQISHL
jgi:hypothetical protein